jgi:RloB-like protein
MGRPKSLRRRVAQLRPRKALLVFGDGARTEPEYLDALRRLPEVRNTAVVDIRIDRGTAGFKPVGLVRAAIAAREKARHEEGEVDEFWCVFDVERPHTHPGLREAAADRAARLGRRHARNGTRLPDNNPSSGMHLLIASAGPLE